MDTYAFYGICMCNEGKCQEKNLLAVFNDFFEIWTLKKDSFF